LKNEVVNGDFRFWQRGTTFTGIAPNPNFELERYTADRWAVTGDGIGGVGTAAVSRQTFTAGQTDIPGAVHFLRYQQSVGATAGGGRIRTKLEGVEAFANRDVTVSLWLKAPSATSSAISVAVNLYNVLGTGSASLAGTEVLSVTSSWQRFVVTKPMPSLVGQTIDRAVAHLRFELALPAGTPTLDVARVQLERASVPSAFEARPYSIELALCRRYYEKSYEPDTVPGTASITGQTMGNGTTAAAIQERFATSKRARPTVTYYSPQSGDINRVYVRFNGTSGQDQPCSGSLDGSRDQLGSASSNQLLAEGVWSAHWDGGRGSLT
jgi:hypothetical protein